MELHDTLEFRQNRGMALCKKPDHSNIQEGKLLALAALPSRERLEFSATAFGDQ